MRKDIICCLSMLWLVCISQVSYSQHDYRQLTAEAFEHQKSGFANLEHRAIGDKVVLNWGDLPHALSNNHLILSNGLEVSYGEMIMLSGDLFGNKHFPISNCAINKRQACFNQQFISLDEVSSNPDLNALVQIPKYRVYLKKLEENLQKAQAGGQPEWQYYFIHGSEISKQLNRLSGGGSFVSGFIPFGEYIKLANVNYDHFIPGALIAYKSGHASALETAISAREAYLNGDLSQAYRLLNKAYAMNGFANHFLTDAMSAGHFRTPRRKIAEQVFLPKALCLIIANFMHDEDNRTGLNVTNRRGISWHAFGDGYLATPEATQHVSILQQVVQESADAVYQAYVSGQMPAQFDELTLMPDYTKISELNNHPPLFKWENNQLLKRKKNFDTHEPEYTAWWSGLVTIIQFNQHDWGDVAN